VEPIINPILDAQSTEMESNLNPLQDSQSTEEGSNLNPLQDSQSAEEGSNLNPLQDKQSTDENRAEPNAENNKKTTEENNTAGKDEEEGKVMKENIEKLNGNGDRTDELESKEGNMNGDEEKMDTEPVHDEDGGEDMNGIYGGENGENEMENDLEDLESDAPSLKVPRLSNKSITPK